jgi:hypothetical protein
MGRVVKSQTTYSPKRKALVSAPRFLRPHGWKPGEKKCRNSSPNLRLRRYGLTAPFRMIYLDLPGFTPDLRPRCAALARRRFCKSAPPIGSPAPNFHRNRFDLLGFTRIRFDPLASTIPGLTEAGSSIRPCLASATRKNAAKHSRIALIRSDLPKVALHAHSHCHLVTLSPCHLVTFLHLFAAIPHSVHFTLIALIRFDWP